MDAAITEPQTADEPTTPAGTVDPEELLEDELLVEEVSIDGMCGVY